MKSEQPRHPWFRRDELPLIQADLPAQFTTAELRDALTALRNWLIDDVDEPYGLIINIARSEPIDASARKMVAEFEQSYAHVEQRFSTGQAYVIRSALVVGVMTAVFWLKPPTYPYRFFLDLEEGRRWAKADFERGRSEFPRGPYWSARGHVA